MFIRVVISLHEDQGTQPRVSSSSRTGRKRRRTYDHNIEEFSIMDQALDLRSDDGSDFLT